MNANSTVGSSNEASPFASAFTFGAYVALAAYAAIRCVQALRDGGTFDPTDTIVLQRSAYAWRTIIALYTGLLAASAALPLSRLYPRLMQRVNRAACIFCPSFLVAQALFVP